MNYLKLLLILFLSVTTSNLFCQAKKMNKSNIEIKHEVQLKTKEDVVYNALSTTKGVSGWFSKNSTVESKVKGKIKLIFFKGSPNSVTMKFVINKLDKNKTIVWTCTENGDEAWVGSTLTWDLSKKGSVKFKHSNFDKKYEKSKNIENIKNGWKHFILKSFKNYCETGKGSPW
ncbi:MAG: hypothetical protein COA79_01270 [Planctomycetota bacterium]|nr:MAG: hypothetical protein COA79_01270 [Planctomycetota bacterium]